MDYKLAVISILLCLSRPALAQSDPQDLVNALADQRNVQANQAALLKAQVDRANRQIDELKKKCGDACEDKPPEK